jgi:hypothetical protein
MKKILVLFMLTILWGCSKKAENKVEDLSSKLKVDTSAINTVPIDNPKLNFYLHFNFQKGKTYQYRLASFTDDFKTLKIDSVITQTVKQSTVYLVDITLDDIDKDGVMEFSCNVASILNNAIANGQAFNYQSGKTKDSTILQSNAQYEALINNPFGLRVGKSGGIIEIFRADKIVNKFLQLKKAPPSIPNEQKEALRNNITQEELRPLLIQIFREMPTNSMMKDSSWAIAEPAAQIFVFKLENTNLFKITSLEKFGSDTLAAIDAGMRSVISGDSKVEQHGTKYNFKKPQLNASGSIYFNLTRGLIQKSSVKTQLNISYSAEGPSQKGGIQKGNVTEVVNSSNILELL